MRGGKEMTLTEHIRSFHAKLAIRRTGGVVPREEYLDFMTFRSNPHPLFTEIFGPLLGLKEEWAAGWSWPSRPRRWRCR
jgi:hypothetical protein